jgi:hypothetical protein
VKRTLYRLPPQLPVGGNFFPRPPEGFNEIYNAKTQEAVRVFQLFTEITPATGNFGQKTLDAMWDYADAYSKWVYRIWSPPAALPVMGPLYVGGTSVLNNQLTHNTDGIPYFPAYDDGWVAGRAVLAVEDLVVDSVVTSSSPGEAFYATGVSKMRFWYGHLTSHPPYGHHYKRGETVGWIYNQGWKSHVHLGIDARPLIGHSLLYGANGNGPDYTTGSPTVGVQLKQALS